MDKKCRWAPFALLLFLGITLLPYETCGLELTRSGFLDRHYAGGRLGVWVNIGDEEPASDSGSIEFSKSSVYGEFFYDYRISRLLALEFSLGIYSRGDIKYSREENTLTGTVNLYPMLLTLKLYPAHSVVNIPFHLYVQSGGGLIYGHQNVIDYNYWGVESIKSRAKFMYVLGAGIDWPVADQIGLTVNFKYMPVKFGKSLAEIKDYSGWTLTFGVGYILEK